MNQFYILTPIIELQAKDWIMTKDEAFAFEKQNLRNMTEDVLERLNEEIKLDLSYDLNSLEKLENYLSKIPNNILPDELYSFTFDVYLFFGNCLRQEAKNHKSDMIWNYMSTLQNKNDDSNLLKFYYYITGFRGKYLGRDPYLFTLLEDLFKQLSDNEYTNMLSEKFKELAVYTHKKAPKS